MLFQHFIESFFAIGGYFEFFASGKAERVGNSKWVHIGVKNPRNSKGIPRIIALGKKMYLIVLTFRFGGASAMFLDWFSVSDTRLGCQATHQVVCLFLYQPLPSFV